MTEFDVVVDDDDDDDDDAVDRSLLWYDFVRQSQHLAA